MNKEYSQNQEYQRKSFKKYRKAIGKIILWSAVAVASAFVIPYEGLFAALKGLLGEYLAASGTFFVQWGLVGAGALGAIFNAINANIERKKFENAQDEEENIIDSLINENADLKRKIEDLEKSKTIIREENTITKGIADKKRIVEVQTTTDTEEKRKKYVK